MKTYAEIVDVKFSNDSYMRGVEKIAGSRTYDISNPGKWRLSTLQKTLYPNRSGTVVVSDTMPCGTPYYTEFFIAEFSSKATALAVCRTMNRMKRKLANRLSHD